MKIIEPSVELINAPDYKTLLTTIEAAGRTCYKSEDKITDGSAEKFVRGIIKRGHEAVIEPRDRPSSSGGVLSGVHSVLQLRQGGLRRRDHRYSSLHFCRHRLPLSYLEAVV